MSTPEERRWVGRLQGQVIFAIAFLVLSLLLLSQIGTQTTWAARTAFFAQPRFWPAVALGGMVLFGALHFWRLPRRRIRRTDVTEAKIWAQPLEYALWFMGYVMLVPVLGYLPVTMAFVPAMMWRMGYRRPWFLWLGVAFGVAVVMVFKTFLQVRIPGGMIYEYLPGALRAFFIVNF
ncbi:tripartite tricarboxylate transporter TctB family protein [Lacimonas salitolerans]|uniref:Tripartite tricarboxylate transporter TctB family protein n=1 Tax=Lacimonas salitolerans TaxID=1323750 RepID=A0ABW4EE50_9RHOB